MPRNASNKPFYKVLRLGLLGIVLSLLAFSSATSAFSAEATFEIRSLYKYKVQISFFSQDRDHSWPGGDRSYNLHDSKMHRFKLTCERGEKICYGAWETEDEDTYWGVGPDDDESCDNCCLVCGSGQVKKIDLE